MHRDSDGKTDYQLCIRSSVKKNLTYGLFENNRHLDGSIKEFKI